MKVSIIQAATVAVGVLAFDLFLAPWLLGAKSCACGSCGSCASRQILNDANLESGLEGFGARPYRRRLRLTGKGDN